MQIEIFQDTACPWCRIGKRHLELALAQWQGEPVEVRYRTFFLNPNIPPEGYAFHSYMQAKGGGRVPLEQFFAAPRDRGEAVGLTFNFEAITRAPNTTLSHQLIAIAPEETKKSFVDAVYAAYFERGQDIGDLNVLTEIARQNGMDGQSVRLALENGEGLEQALADAREARELGISGVPFFIFDRKYAISGAHPVEAIEEVMRRVVQERRGEQL